MLLDLLHDLGIGLLFIFIAFMIFDWSRIWWYSRRHGFIRVSRNRSVDAVAHRWANAYLGYKIWTWVIRLAAWAVMVWQFVLGICWLVQAVTWSTVS